MKNLLCLIFIMIFQCNLFAQISYTAVTELSNKEDHGNGLITYYYRWESINEECVFIFEKPGVISSIYVLNDTLNAPDTGYNMYIYSIKGLDYLNVNDDSTKIFYIPETSYTLTGLENIPVISGSAYMAYYTLQESVDSYSPIGHYIKMENLGGFDKGGIIAITVNNTQVFNPSSTELITLEPLLRYSEYSTNLDQTPVSSGSTFTGSVSMFVTDYTAPGKTYPDSIVFKVNHNVPKIYYKKISFYKGDTFLDFNNRLLFSTDEYDTDGYLSVSDPNVVKYLLDYPLDIEGEGEVEEVVLSDVIVVIHTSKFPNGEIAGKLELD